MKIVKKSNYNFKNNLGKLVFKSATVSCGIVLVSTIASCSYNVNNGQTLDTFEQQSISSQSSVYNTSETQISESSVSSSEYISDTSSNSDISYETVNTTESSINYEFTWNDSVADMFNDYVFNECGHYVFDLVCIYGIDDNPILQGYYTDFINDTFGCNYDSVPFETANNFSRLINGQGTGITHDVVDDVDRFNSIWYYDEGYGAFCCLSSPFVSKYYFSYLVATGKPFGEMVGYSEFNQINPGNVEISDFTNMRDTYMMVSDDSFNPESPEHLVMLLSEMNAAVFQICRADCLTDFNIANHDDRAEIINGYVEQHTPGVRIGQVITREDYIEMFGEEPIQFEFLPEAPVMQSDNPSRQR